MKLMRVSTTIDTIHDIEVEDDYVWDGTLAAVLDLVEGIPPDDGTMVDWDVFVSPANR